MLPGYYLILDTSIATTITTIDILLLLYGLKKKIGALDTKEYITIFIKARLASGIMGVIAYLVYHWMYGALGVSKLYNLISLVVAAGIGAIQYVIVCYIFKVEEIRMAVYKIKERLFGDKA